MNYRYPLIAAVAVAAAVSGFYIRSIDKPPADAPAASAASQLMGLPLATPQGQPASLKQWSGKVLVVNFWATWCPPCLEEMPEFSRVQEKLGANVVQFVGIGIDTPDKLQAFQKRSPVSYPLLMGAYDVLKLSSSLGNASMSLPFTVILDKNGRIVHTKQGKLDGPELEKILGPYLY